MSISLTKTNTNTNQVLATVFLNTSLSIFTTMLVAYLIEINGLVAVMKESTLLGLTAILIPLPILFASMWAIQNFNRVIANLALHVFAASMGLSMAFLFAKYTDASIIHAFVGTSGIFLSMAAIGYFTNVDLSNLGKLLFIALIGIIITSVINIFLGSSVLNTVLNVITIIVFMGLTAYDVQNIKDNIKYDDVNNIEVFGAISLYLDFINIFTSLLELTGDSE